MLAIATGMLLIAGSAFVCVAGLGIVRLPDLMLRMHASTKAGTLGCGLVLLATALHFHDVAIASRAIATFLFLLITAPVAAHIIGRAAYRSGIRLWSGTVVDEWARDRDADGVPRPEPGAASDSRVPPRGGEHAPPPGAR